MRLSYILLFTVLFSENASAQESKLTKKPDPRKPLIEVEAGCGMCKFGLKDKDCLLTIRKNDKVLHVKGTDIDDHGDAHGDDGFCNAIRRATIQGQVKGDTIMVTYFQLIPKSAK